MPVIFTNAATIMTSYYSSHWYLTYFSKKKAFCYVLENKEKDKGIADAILLCVR